MLSLARVAQKRQSKRRADAKKIPEFRGAALSLQTARNDVALIGPAGTGKSFAALYLMDRLARAYPGFRGLIARKTRSSLSTTGLVTFERFVLGLDDARVVSGPQRRNREVYHYANGSDIEVGGLDPNHIAKILSSEYDYIYVQQAEEINEPEYETLSTRMRSGVLGYELIVLDANPSGSSHWLKRRIEAGTIDALYSKHTDNPTLWDRIAGDWTERGRRYIERLKKLTGVRYKRLFLGDWSSAEGAVYPEYDPAIHLIDAFAIPSDWPRVRGIDFGYTNPFVCQWYAIDPISGNLFMYREIYRTQRLVEDHAVLINRHSDGEPVIATVADHDAEDRATLLKNGIATTAAYKAVSTGIEAVALRLRNATDDWRQSTNALYFFRDCLAEEPDEALIEEHKPTTTVDEIDGYVWKKAKDGKPAPDEPIKANDHGLDTIRYVVAAVDQIGAELTEDEYMIVQEFDTVISPF